MRIDSDSSYNDSLLDSLNGAKSMICSKIIQDTLKLVRMIKFLKSSNT